MVQQIDKVDMVCLVPALSKKPSWYPWRAVS